MYAQHANCVEISCRAFVTKYGSRSSTLALVDKLDADDASRIAELSLYDGLVRVKFPVSACPCNAAQLISQRRHLRKDLLRTLSVQAVAYQQQS